MSIDNEREVEEDGIENIFASVTHFHFDLFLNQIISITHPPIPPKYLSLSLIVDEHTNTPLQNSYLSYKSTTIHVLTLIQITPQLLILLFQTTHSISLSLPKQSFLLSILKINLFLPSSSFLSLNLRM